ncbi:MAG: ABC transporter permease [Blautia sp.]|nr:ABC transporter permease [Blautia sp.]MDY5032234.1 ABC transporter permease [Blautia sp.]
MKQYKHLIKPYVIWAVLLLVIPLFLIALYAFTEEGNEVLTLSFTLENFAKFAEATYLNVILKSFKLGIITTVICLVLGYPLAFMISRYSEKVQNILIMLVTIPMWINLLLRTYAWMNLLADNGIINHILEYLGIGSISMMYTDFSVILGLVCNFMPFMIIPIHTSLSKMDRSLIEAAYDLGANKIQTFCKVIWQLSIPGVLNGIMMVFLMAISSFVIPKLLGGGQYMLIGNLIESQFISVGNWNFGSAISLILAVVILIFMGLMKRMDKQEKQDD